MANPDFHLIIEMKSTNKEAMKENLKRILEELDSNYGKPCQGTSIQYQCETIVKTPTWNMKAH